MPRSTRDTIAELVAKFEPVIQNAFLAAVDEIRNAIVLKEVIAKLERADVAGAVEAMHIDDAVFARLEMAIAEAYNSGGQAFVGNLPRLTDPSGNRIIWRFGVRNVPGEDWTRRHAASLVTRTTDDMKEAIRVALKDGLSQGRNPRSTALDVVGRVSRATNRREGGIIGLTAPQERYVASARAELVSGDVDQLRHYLTRGRRDKRFDRTVLKAIREGKALPADVADRIVGRYSDKLLALRGEMLARTETMIALGQSRDDAMRQQISEDKVTATDITKIWRSARDGRVRHTHALLHGKTSVLDGSFQSPSGAMLRFPGDPDAPASEIVGCRCWLEYKIDYFAQVVRRQREKA